MLGPRFEEPVVEEPVVVAVLGTPEDWPLHARVRDEVSNPDPRGVSGSADIEAPALVGSKGDNDQVQWVQCPVEPVHAGDDLTIAVHGSRTVAVGGDAVVRTKRLDRLHPPNRQFQIASFLMAELVFPREARHPRRLLAALFLVAGWEVVAI